MFHASFSRGRRLWAALLLGLSLCLPACADLTLGGNARTVAMGGAGLASGDSSESATLNPATLAYTGLRFGIEWPTINTRMQGASFGDVFSLLGKPSLSPSKALDFALKLGDERTSLDATAGAGLLLPSSDIRATAALHAELDPNAAFQQWVSSGANPADLTGDARIDIYGAGVATLPSVGLGITLPNSGEGASRFSIGLRAKPVRSYYSHYIVDKDSVSGTEISPQRAVEMGGKDYLKQSSFGADLGLMYSPGSMPDLHLAVVVDNAIEPKALSFSSGTVASRQLSPRTVSAGMAYVKPMVTLAADLVDLTKAHGDPQVRVGGELRLPLSLALRGGYNTVSGFTAGIGFGGLGIAYSKHTPILITEAIKF